METMQKIIKHCRQQRPVMDVQGKFLFFSNNKVAQTSISRRAIKDRTLIFKDNNAAYYECFDKINVEEFQSLYKFTIVRNPWSRVVSAFFYLRNKSRSGKAKGHNLKSMSFADFVLNVLVKAGPDFDPHFEYQHPKAFCNEECFVDFIGKIENLSSDWKEIADRIGAPDSLPHVNRSKHKPYQVYYDSKTIQVVQGMYQRDIDLFQYKFGE